MKIRERPGRRVHLKSTKILNQNMNTLHIESDFKKKIKNSQNFYADTTGWYVINQPQK